MISTVINSLRVFKCLYDLAFSEKQFYVDSRAELKNGIGFSIEQFKEGYNNPRLASEKPAVPKPLKIALMVLAAILVITIMFTGR
jgi:hypothetical protein